MIEKLKKEAIRKPKELVKVLLVYPLQKFFQIEAIGGILLIIATVAAMICANSDLAQSYHHLWETSLRIGIGNFEIDKTLHHWINDGLMAVFFFLVGLEIKREFLAGELASIRTVVLPMSAALGGMVFPALLYFLFNMEGPGLSGWGIPMATDIAFALGALALLGSGVPAGLLIFLTALAIVDDLGAVAVIALFYGGKIAVEPLVSGFIVLAISIFCNKTGVRRPMVYVLLGIALWLAFLKSGIHATVAGVLLAMTIPTNADLTGDQFAKKVKNLMDDFLSRDRVSNPLERAEKQQAVIQEIEFSCRRVEAPLQRIEHGLHPWVTYGIMPIFAFANAGVEIPFHQLSGLFSSPIILGIWAGLFIGKQAGIFGFSWIAVKAGWAQLPRGVSWLHLYGVSLLGGIGFTMSLFISNLAFMDPDLLAQAKVAILIASLMAGVAGYWILKTAIQKASSPQTP